MNYPEILIQLHVLNVLIKKKDLSKAIHSEYFLLSMFNDPKIHNINLMCASKHTNTAGKQYSISANAEYNLIPGEIN